VVLKQNEPREAGYGRDGAYDSYEVTFVLFHGGSIETHARPGARAELDRCQARQAAPLRANAEGAGLLPDQVPMNPKATDAPGAMVAL
jgi:hypothetical protein